MTAQTTADLLGYFGALCGVAMVVPQLVRTLRNRAVGGVSALSWSLTGLACLAWLLYGVRAAEPPQIPGNVLIVLGCFVIVLAVPGRHAPYRRGAAFVLAAVPVLGAALLVAPVYLAYLGFVIGLVSAWPQTVESIARARQGGESAVSVSAWLLRGAAQACWFGYGLLMRDVAIMIATCVTLAGAVGLLVAERARAGRAAPPAGAVLDAARQGASCA